MRALLLTCVLSLCIATHLGAQSPTQAKKVIVSVRHPVDSLGETVYQTQGKDDSDQPIIAGVLTNPKVINLPTAKYSKKLEAEEFSGGVTLTFIVSANGKAIDIEVEPDANPEAAKCAIEAARAYEFKPALLNERPVAVPMKLTVTFSHYK